MPSQGLFLAQEGVVKWAPEAMASTIVKLSTLIFAEVNSQNDTTVVELTFQETQKTDFQPNESLLHFESKI